MLTFEAVYILMTYIYQYWGLALFPWYVVFFYFAFFVGVAMLSLLSEYQTFTAPWDCLECWISKLMIGVFMQKNDKDSEQKCDLVLAECNALMRHKSGH